MNLSILWYCHQKEDQNSKKFKKVKFIIQSTTPIGHLSRYHTNHDGICPLTKDHYYGKQVVSV